MKYYTTSKLSENIHETPEGFLLCLGVPVARTGVMEYGEGETPLETDDRGSIQISRDEAEVFRPETIASFEGKPVTITHPEQFVDPSNWSRLAKGVMQNVRRGTGENKNDLIADLLITDSVAINLVKNGLREVSCGYEAEYTQTDEGKGIQTNIIGNHLALVEQGRAGGAYAINDHKKGKGETKMKMSERIKAIFAKAQDEAMKIAKDEEMEKGEEKKPEAKDESKAYDELIKMVKDLSDKVLAMGGAKDEEKKPEEKMKDEGEEKKADDADPMSAMEDRLKALEASVAKLLEMEAGDEMSEDEEMESGDEDDLEAKDADKEEKGALVGDTASRAEILAPGIKVTKDVKAQALKTAYATKEGKKVIDSLTGGKAPTFDSAEKVDTLFIAASELLKVSRNGDLAKTKQTNDYAPSIDKQGPVSAEKMNEINAQFYKR